MVMGEDLPALVRLHVCCDRSAPSAVRAALNSVAGIGRRLDDVMLVASELVSNAVLHSGCASGDMIEVRVERIAEHLLISVRDPGFSRNSTQVSLTNERPFGGLGLRVIEQIARRWGTERDHGYRVWAELAMSGSVD